MATTPESPTVGVEDTLFPHSKQESVRLLLVEDNPGDARLTQEMIREEPSSLPVEVTWADSLARGIEELERGQTDIVLLDLSLPDSHGMETFTLLHKQAPKIPIVVLSGHRDEELATELVKRGAQDCLTKDMISGVLIRRSINYAIERKQHLEALGAMQMQLIQAEKMESVGRLAAGVAHEVKNPLAMIILGLDYLDDGIDPEDPNIPVVLTRMRDAVRRADTIIKGLVDFSSARRLDLQKRDLNALLKRTVPLVQHELRVNNIVLEMDLGENLPMVRLDEPKLEQVLINVIMNSAHAMEKGGKLTIHTFASKLEDVPRDEGARTAGHVRSGDAVVTLRLDDTGHGIPEDKMDALFDPFFTTKATGEGTGLGLSVVKKIIDLHQGLISLENRPEGGVRTSISLKVAPE